MELVIVNTGCANISSVKFAVERLGVKAVVSSEAGVIQSADRVILPGVGTAKAAMKNMAERDLIDTVRGLEQPVLGICLGMQLLSKRSEEGNVDCLGLIEAQVKRMQVGDLRLPHMGWNKVEDVAHSPLMEGLSGEAFYFVHSYAMPVGDFTLGRCDYGMPFSALVQQSNFYGAQFHPERSSKAGAKLLKNFIYQGALGA